MPETLGVKEYAGMIGKGLVLQMAPKITGGMVNELFHRWNMNLAEVTLDVQNDRSLWDRIDPGTQEELKHLMSLMANLDFITPEVIIEGITADFPSIASLFLGWPEAMDWLAKQIENLKALGSHPPETKPPETKTRKRKARS